MWRRIFWRSRKSAPERTETEQSRSEIKFSILNATKRVQTAPQRLSTRASGAESFGDAENQHRSAQKPKTPGQTSIYGLPPTNREKMMENVLGNSKIEKLIFDLDFWVSGRSGADFRHLQKILRRMRASRASGVPFGRVS